MAIKKRIRSTRQKLREDKKLYQDAQLALQKIDTSAIDARIAALDAEIAALDKIISDLQKLYNLKVKGGYSSESIKETKTALEFYKAQRAPLVAEVAALRDENVSNKNTNDTTAENEATDGTEDVAAATTASNQKSTTLEYNASGVKELHFSERADFSRRIMSAANEPRSIRAANQLWKSAKSSKGMIVTSEQVLKAWNTGSNKLPGGVKNYGFQFQYNPGTVGMSYFTSPNVDVTLMTSGQEMFNLAGTSGSQGAISFQIIINRIFDMQYYTKNGYIDPQFNPRRLYAKPPAGKKEEKLLYSKGTMYDVEYLLRTLMGTTMKSYLRGEDTADMGWLPAIPVELHLGNNLRYLGTINTIQLNHIIFNERMVPLFTTVDVQFTRLPDYPAK
jgi:hypothetical protein